MPDPSQIPRLPNTMIVRGACPHDCPDTCALLTTVVDGKAIKVQGDPDHPTTHGSLCAKVAAYPERTYASDRLLQPMQRVGPKGPGQGRFEPISWDEALSTIAQKLEQIAKRRPEAILPYSYAGTMGWVQGEGMASRFFHRLGASLLDRTICSSAGMAGLATTLGGSVGMDVEAYAQSQLILIWGSNSITSNLHFWTFAQQAKRNGAWLVAIDPYRSDTALKCNEHIALMPGTDAALALGLMHELIGNDWLDHDYIAQHTVGFEALRSRAMEYPPHRVAEICGIDAQQVRDLARRYGTTRPAAIRLNYGMQRVRGGANAVRAIASLPALVGAWRDAAGGMLLSASGHVPMDAAALTRPDLIPGWPKHRPRTINMSTIGDALLARCADGAPEIEAMVVYNSNPAAVAPDSENVLRGLAREDLFTVVLEHFQTDTADYADIVLPATTQLEHYDLHKTYGHRYLVANLPAIAPVGQARSNADIFRELARRMGFHEPALQASDRDIARSALQWDDPRMGGETLESIEAKGWVKLNLPAATYAQGGFPSVSGKVEFESPMLVQQGLDPVPDWIAPHESAHSQPALASRYPLACISPPARNFMNSTFVNMPSLRKPDREPVCELHPEDAGVRNLKDGQMVAVVNDRGRFQARLRVTERCRVGVTVAWGVWWHKLSPGGRNVNAVTSQALTDMGRAPTFYDCLVQVEAL
jgi:anaerobic selenocysteine-containing dehydrogenase